MKSICVLSVLIVTANCGLLDNLLENKEEQKNPDLLKKIVTDLNDDGKIVVDTLTAGIKKNKNKKEDPKNNEKEEDKPEQTEVKETTPKSPEATTAGKTEASTVKAEEVSPTKTEEETPKTEAKEEPAAPKAK